MSITKKQLPSERRSMATIKDFSLAVYVQLKVGSTRNSSEYSLHTVGVATISPNCLASIVYYLLLT